MDTQLKSLHDHKYYKIIIEIYKFLMMNEYENIEYNKIFIYYYDVCWCVLINIIKNNNNNK